MAEEQPGDGESQGADNQGAGDPVVGRDPVVGTDTVVGRDTTSGSDIDDVKRKFREALDRKRDKHAHANAEGAQGTGKVHDAHGPASSRRSFRRKSGG